MKHLNGKEKDKTNQTRKKTSQKPGFSNSGKGYQITYMNLRSRCIVENKTSIIKREMRTYQVKNIQSTVNSFPPVFSDSGKGYQIIYKNLRSRCIMENEASIIKREMRRCQVKKEASLIRPQMRRYQVEKEVSVIRPEMRRYQVEKEGSFFTAKMRSYQKNIQFTNIQKMSSISLPVYRSTTRYTGLNTFKNKAVTFFFENGEYEIFVEDLIGNQERGSLSVDFFSYKNSNEEDSPSLVVLKPRPSNIDLQVQANDQNLELHKSENEDSAQESKFFILHRLVPGYVSFECLCPQGLYIGVQENHLKLMEKKEDDEAFLFRLT